MPYTLVLQYQDGYQRQIAVTMQPEDLDKPLISKLLANTYTLVLRK